MRLFLGVFLIVGVAAFFVMRVFVDEVKPGVRQAMESSLVDTANVLAGLAAQDMESGNIADGRFAREIEATKRRHYGATVWKFRKDHFDYRIYVVDAQGKVVYDSLGIDTGRDYSRWNNVYRTLHGGYGARSSVEEPGDGVHTVMHVSAPIRDAAGKIIGVLTVANPNRTTEPFIVASQREMLRKGGLLLGLSASIGLAMTIWLARGIGRLNAYAQAVSAGRRAEPPSPRRDEIGDLGQALETMRRKLDGKEYVEGYVQALTHEMKGPLAAIRGAAELLQEPLPATDRERFARNVLRQGERLTEMIDKLLALAAVEQQGWLQATEQIDAGSLVADVVDLLSTVARQVDVAMHVELQGNGLRLSGDRFLLRQALLNLGDNAIAFAPRGSVITWSVREEGESVSLSCTDEGTGIPDYAVERVFERFYSLSRPRSGERSSGLGLPFVREVANLHHGHAFLRNRPDGGAIAGMTLPKS